MLGIFLDTETTGLDPALHCPIDIACKIIDFSSNTIIGEYQSIIKHPLTAWEARDSASIQINGFTWDMISQGKDISAVSVEMIALFTKHKIERGTSVFICQNPSFDRAFFNQLIDVYVQENLNWPYHWLDFASMYWTKLVQTAIDRGEGIPEKISVSKDDIATAYHLSPETTPHRAMNGVDHLILCYQALFNITFISLSS